MFPESSPALDLDAPIDAADFAEWYAIRELSKKRQDWNRARSVKVVRQLASGYGVTIPGFEDAGVFMHDQRLTLRHVLDRGGELLKAAQDFAPNKRSARGRALAAQGARVDATNGYRLVYPLKLCVEYAKHLRQSNAPCAPAGEYAGEPRVDDEATTPVRVVQ